MRIRLAKSDITFSAAPDQSLLDAALDASLNLPHSCKGGNCGSCRARLLQGEIHYPNGPPLGLSAAEAAEGFVLLCQCYARGDLTIETLEISTPEQIRVKRLPARIERSVLLSHDVMGLFLRLPAAEDFSFEAGQYLDVMLPGGRRRSFSIASPPHDSRLLELHVRKVQGGEFSAPLFERAAQSALLSIEGPLGQFAYRAGTAPMLLIGGGTGIAPLLSILRHVVETGLKRDLRIYWGVRSERDLYAHATLEALARYVPVLSEASSAWAGRRGMVHEAVLEDIQDLQRYDVYAAGPPAMIGVVRREFALRGVAPERLYFDSFDYAPDALDRQRSSASTKA
ncbi:MAG TPA: 2Fe-2S iron-sulfur cluster-binding protein [Steroidobacteraceae bacterium]|nr:2Fe-2S iron-sulfur cluster-binding protein [Steroidobacteraceae bacterium]